MKIKKLILLLILVLISFNLFSQEKFNRQAAYVELLGSGVIGSVNYDFHFKPGNDGFGIRGGFGYVPDGLVFPIGLNGLIGKNRIAFEYGVGISAAILLNSVSNVQAFSTGIDNFVYIWFAKAGIRVTPKKNGLFFNFHWNPLVNSVETEWAWFGLGIGYSWKKEQLK